MDRAWPIRADPRRGRMAYAASPMTTSAITASSRMTAGKRGHDRSTLNTSTLARFSRCQTMSTLMAALMSSASSTTG